MINNREIVSVDKYKLLYVVCSVADIYCDTILIVSVGGVSMGVNRHPQGSNFMDHYILGITIAGHKQGYYSQLVIVH